MAPFQIGVMLENVQLSDITGIDVFGNLSTEYIKVVTDEFDIPGMMPLATDMKFHYISSKLEQTLMTPSLVVQPTVTYEDAPRDLDILIIGGPSLHQRPAAADIFLKEASKETKIIMTTCIGSLWLASSGVLDGKRATTNRGALPLAKKLYPKVEWIDQRWVVDGKYWTAGGAGAGMPIFTKRFHNVTELKY